VLPSPCYIFSDAHLGFAAPEIEASVLAFLRYLRGRAGSVVINGDLFEFWFEWRSVVPRGSYRVLAALHDLRADGVPVLMTAGNHDCWGGDVLREDIGIEFQTGPWHGEIAGWRAWVEHGDGLRGAEDRRYRRMRSVLRHPWAVRAFRWLHPDVGMALAGRSSHASRTYVARDGGRGLREVAAERLAADRALDLVVYGHSHVAVLEQFPSGQIYGNPGSWLDAPTYLRVQPARVELVRWDGSTEGTNLHAFDRTAEKPLT
jgi:UDP-2,3-diacylglucosamine hydrolase